MEKKEIIKKDIGKRIEFIRNEKNMTKEEFAKLINISGQHLGRAISGEKGLSIEKIIELSEKTGYSTDFILKGITNKSDVINKKISKIKNNINSINDIIKTLI
ncbi:MAG: helix-turn-helix transcriptional regulator [Clostridia bacterium]|nr:helix-turn-helix transcriptional regulator [Clostridia bacterium]